jgi:hypothetical protein
LLAVVSELADGRFERKKERDMVCGLSSAEYVLAGSRLRSAPGDAKILNQPLSFAV